MFDLNNILENIFNAVCSSIKTEIPVKNLGKTLKLGAPNSKQNCPEKDRLEKLEITSILIIQTTFYEVL